jgi:hypothetical protein
MDALDLPQDECDADHDRLLWLGAITEGAANLFTPKLRVVAAILDELVQVEEPGEIGDKRHRRTLVVRFQQMIPVKMPDFFGFEPLTADASD